MFPVIFKKKHYSLLLTNVLDHTRTCRGRSFETHCCHQVGDDLGLPPGGSEEKRPNCRHQRRFSAFLQRWDIQHGKFSSENIESKQLDFWECLNVWSSVLLVNVHSIAAVGPQDLPAFSFHQVDTDQTVRTGHRTLRNASFLRILFFLDHMG